MRRLHLFALVALCAGLAPAQETEVKRPRPLPQESLENKTWAPPPAKEGQPAPSPEALAPAVQQILQKQADQLSSGAPTFQPRIPDAVFHDDVQGGLLASSRRFKSQYTGTGMSFIPFLGSQVPQSFPFTLVFEEARVGGVPVAFAGTVAPVRSGDVIAYDRGLVREVYEVTTRHVEQKFVLHAFAGQGDLVVRMRVATELPFDATAPEGFRFRNMYGGVTYGKATVLDAGGRAEPAESRWDDGAIELIVPASFLASAVYPVTIDPVIQPFVEVDLSAINFFLPDIAYDASTDRYLVTFEEAFSGTDHDIWAETRTGAGAVVAGGAGYIDRSTDFWALPKCASNNIANNFLVVAQRQPSGGGAWAIWGRTRAAGSISMGSQFQISGVESGDKVNPDVGGDPSLAPPTFYCVVWQRNFSATDLDIHFRLVNSDGSLPGPVLGLENTGRVDFAPTISKSDGDSPVTSQSWTVVWSFQFSPTDTDVWGALIDWDGIPATPFAIETATSNELEPTVSSPTDVINGRRTYLVAYERVVGTAGDGDLIARVLNGPNVISFTANLSTLFGMTSGKREASPTADSDGCRFAVGFEHYFNATTGDVDVYVGTVHLAGATITRTDGGVAWTVPVTSDASPEITSTRSGGGGPIRYAQVWDTYPTPTNGNIVMGLYNGHAPTGGHSTGVAGCGGLTLGFAGIPALGGSVTYSLVGLQGAPIMILGTPTSLPLCPSCTIGVSLAGALILPVPTFSATIPCDASLIGAVLAIQGGDYPASSGCPVSGGNVRTSNSIRIQIQ